jgi:hypothetical protein
MSGYRSALPEFVETLPIGMYYFRDVDGMEWPGTESGPVREAVEAELRSANPEIIIYERQPDGWQMQPKDLR